MDTVSVENIAEQVPQVRPRTASAVTVRLHPAIEPATTASMGAVDVLSFLLRSGALAALTLGVWRLGVDLGWTQDFIVASGVWSHWQAWIALAIGLNAGATHMSRPRRRNAGR